jgi:trehalose/maltose hydrolase-like predicted phosphorylase
MHHTTCNIQKGAEILIETARFCPTRVTPTGAQYSIRGVVGPDEYHFGVDDNAYTNWMARLNLQVAAQQCRGLAERDHVAWDHLARRLRIESREIDGWERIAARLYLPVPNDQGVIEQFRGYFQLKPVEPHQHEEGLKAPVNRLLEWDQINREQLIKQADVLMIPFLFPEAFPPEVVEANYRYYEPRTDHGSSLSPSVHAAVAAQIGNWKDAERFWKMGLQLDLLDLMRNTALGIHLGNMAGTWQALMFHILGRSNPGVRDLFLAKYGPVEFESKGTNEWFPMAR